jgi:hypothetical protein
MPKPKPTKRVKNSEEDVPFSLELLQPGTPVSTTAPVTDVETPVSINYAQASQTLVDTDVDSEDGIFFNREGPIPRKLKRKTETDDYFKDDPMETDIKPEVFKSSKSEDQDEDEIPIAPDVKPEADVAEVENNPDEDYPLGNTVKPGSLKTVKKGNGQANIPVIWMVPNIKIKNFAVAHIGVLSYGFETNGDPKPGFQNHVLRLMVQDEETDFFTTKNVGKQSLVDLVDSAGEVVAVPDTTRNGSAIKKNVSAVFFVTRFEQSPDRINALFSGFVNTINKATWNGTPLNQKVQPLTPEHFIHPTNGVGAFVGQAGCEQLIKRFFSDFSPRNRWGKDHRDVLAQLYNPGAWTLENATYFGAPLSWLSQTERDMYAEQVANRDNNGV